MEVWKIKLFINVCVLCAAFDCLQLKENELICLFEECLAMALFLEDVRTQKTSYFLLGTLCEKLLQIGKAIKYFSKYLQIANEVRDINGIIAAHENLGHAYYLQGNFHEATKYHVKCAKIAKEIGDKKVEGNAYANLGDAYQALGKCNKAIEYHQKCLSIAMEIGDRKLEGIAYGNLGKTYQLLGNYQDAIKYQEKCLGIANEISDIAGVAQAYGNLGDIHHLLGNYQKAIEYHEKSLGIALRIGDRREEGLGYGKLGNAYRSLGNYQKAKEYHDKCLSITMEVGDKLTEGATYGNLGNISHSLGKYHEAIEYHKSCLSIAIEIGDRKVEEDTYGNIGSAYYSLGKYHEANKYFNKGLSIAREMKDKAGEERAYINLGTVSQSLGKYHEAIRYYEKSLSIAIEIGDRRIEGVAYGNIGTFHKALGKYPEAIDYQKKCIKISKEIGDRQGEDFAYKNLGTVYMILDKYDEAIEYQQKCLTIAVEIGDRKGEADAYGNIGKTYQVLGNYPEALEYVQKRLKIAEEIGDKRGEAYGYGNMGGIYKSLGKYNEAIKHHEKGLRIAIEIDDRKTEGACYASLGDVYQSLAEKYQKLNDTDQQHANLKEAETYFKKSIQSYELVFDDLEQDQHKISIVDTFIVAYRSLAEVYVETQQTEEALLVSDRGRARALGDLLTVKYSMNKEGTSKSGSIEVTDIEMILSTSNFGILFYALHPDNLVANIWVLAHQSPPYFHHSEITGFESPSKPSSLSKQKSVDSDEKSMFKLVKKTYDKMKVREGVKCEDRSLGLPKVEDKDIEEKPVLSQVAEQNTTEGRENGKEINNTDARNIYEEDHDDADEEKPLELLYDALVAPVQHKLVQDEIVIIPDGDLYMVPFAALQDPNTGQFLSETKRIRLAPSLTTLKALQESSDDQHYKSGALIVGNPKIGDVMFEGSEISFANLPGAEGEAKEIAKLLEVEPLIGRQATKEAVVQKLLVGVSVIHFAAHGSGNGQILLAPSASSASSKMNSIPEEQDFVLTMKEAQESGIRAQLVVLSCCHSGRGEIKSEGVVGLSRAFLAAGARAVVASLWAIDDDATKVFMLKFYTHLKKGESASKSLQQAMKDMRETERYSEPRYWAAFFLIGDDVTISV